MKPWNKRIYSIVHIKCQGNMSDVIIDLWSPAHSSSDPPPAAAASSQSTRRYRLSLVPILSTFSENPEVDGRPIVPPTLRLAENTPLEAEPPLGQQHWQSSPTLVLGRANNTRVLSAKVSRDLLDVRLFRRQEQGPNDARTVPSIVVKLLKPKKCVRINGSLLNIRVNETRELQAGDVLSLCHDEFGYNVLLEEYKPEVVDLLESDDEEGGDDGGEIVIEDDLEESAASAADNTANGEAEATDRTAARAQQEATETAFCAICIGVLAKTQILVPCAHHVCEGCATEAGMFAQLQSKKKKKKNDGTTSNAATCCPLCQEPINSIMPSKIMDNFIWNNMLSGAFEFELEDIVEYLRKSGAKPTEEEARRIFSRHEEYLAEYLKEAN